MSAVRLKANDLAEMRAQEIAHVTATMGLEFRIQRELRSPNTILGRHWRAKSRERARWQAAIVNALVNSYGLAQARNWLGAGSGLPNATTVETRRMRVTVERLTPSKRRFIRDDDNLRFAVKPLLDAIKRNGLIKDDRREWIDHPEPTQRVSDDGTFWTVIRIDPIAATAAETIPA